MAVSDLPAKSACYSEQVERTRVRYVVRERTKHNARGPRAEPSTLGARLAEDAATLQAEDLHRMREEIMKLTPRFNVVPIAFGILTIAAVGWNDSVNRVGVGASANCCNAGHLCSTGIVPYKRQCADHYRRGADTAS